MNIQMMVSPEQVITAPFFLDVLLDSPLLTGIGLTLLAVGGVYLTACLIMLYKYKGELN